MNIKGLDILKFRKKHNLTQSAFAELLGVSFRTVQNYEKGETIPKSKEHVFAEVFRRYDESEILNHSIASDRGLKHPSEEDLLSQINKIDDSELRSSINTGVHKLYKEIERLKNKMSSVIDILDGKK